MVLVASDIQDFRLDDVEAPSGLELDDIESPGMSVQQL